MISNIPTVPEAAQRVRAALDEEAGLLEFRRRQLQELAVAILRRDNPRLEQLLPQVETGAALQAQADGELRAAQAALGDALLLGEPHRLARLIEALPAPLPGPLRECRQRVLRAMDDFRRQHLETSLLLVECSRINRVLLEGLFAGESVRTYSRGGGEDWTGQGGLMNAEI